MAAEKTPPDSEMRKDDLYLVDGSGFIFRAYFALPQNLTNPAGQPVGAVLGFVNMLMKLLSDFHAPNIAVIFDAARKNFRYDIYDLYKANRDDPPEDLIPQFPMFRTAAEAFGIPALEVEGYEADDLIAAYARLAQEQGKNVTIVGSDKDLYQLVNDHVRLFDPLKQKYIGPAEVAEKFGVPPEKVVEVQALSGDSVDNIPGVPGIGPKTAAELINTYGDVETLLARAGEITQNKRRESLIEHAENARISRKLVELDRFAPVPMAVEDLKARDLSDNKALVAFLQEQGFKSVLARLGASTETAGPTTASAPQNAAPAAKYPSLSDNKYTLITDEKTLTQWIVKAYEEGILAIDTETTSLTPAMADLVGISIAITPGEAAYIPLGHKQSGGDLFGGGGDAPDQLPMDKAIALLKPLLEDESVLKIGHNMKYDWQMFKQKGIHTAPCDDTMLISYVLDGSTVSHGMDNLSERYLGHKPISYDEVTGTGKSRITFDLVSLDKALDYAAEDADVTLRLHKLLKPRLVQEKMVSVYENIDRPLIPVIAQMELEGIKVDSAILKSMSTEFGLKLAALEKEIQDIAGMPFNVASPKQVGEILFDSMGLSGGKKTKTGQWQTDADLLEDLAAQGHEIIKKILEYRMLAKLKSTYTDALQEQLNPRTGRVHTSFAVAHTSTGRLASSDPNLQNIPIRTEEGRKIREAFVAAPGHVLLSVDYSQVELRLAAQMAGVEALKKAFRDGEDIHTLTASQVFGVPLDQVTPDIRRQAKAVNFGIIYGISGWGLAKQLGIDAGTANEFIKRYLTKFKEIQDFMEARKDEARANLYVKTLYGRKCFTPNINNKMQGLKLGAERAAINAPLQGTAADIMKIAMAAMPPALAKAGLKARMLLQVHDELIFEVPEGEAEKTAVLVKDVMENAFKFPGINFDVPLDAEAGTGLSWAAAH